jgi:hypothetical protein
MTNLWKKMTERFKKETPPVPEDYITIKGDGSQNGWLARMNPSARRDRQIELLAGACSEMMDTMCAIRDHLEHQREISAKVSESLTALPPVLDGLNRASLEQVQVLGTLNRQLERAEWRYKFLCVVFSASVLIGTAFFAWYEFDLYERWFVPPVVYSSADPLEFEEMLYLMEMESELPAGAEATADHPLLNDFKTLGEEPLPPNEVETTFKP